MAALPIRGGIFLKSDCFTYVFKKVVEDTVRTIIVGLLIAIIVLQGGATMAQQERLTRTHGLAYRNVEDIRRLDALHQAGLAQDHSQLPTLLGVVKNPPDHFQFFTAVHSLARLGDPQALPDVESAMRRYAVADKEASDYAEVARARLLGEVEAHKHPGTTRQQAQVRLSAFMSALNLDADTLNTEVAKNLRHLLLNGGETYVRETYALRELADIVYLKRDLALATAAKQAGINFDLDAGAKYKVQLAPLTSHQRVDWLINELSNKIVLKGDDLYLQQLAADEGKAASRAAAAKLKEMDQHRERYVDNSEQSKGRIHHTGFAALFRVIQAVGDADQEAVISQFSKDTDSWICYYANQSHPMVKMGIPWKWRTGY